MDGEPTSAERVGQLSQGQKECLRLVWQHFESKQIGPLLNLSSHAVDARLKRAIAILAVPDRHAAARLLAAHEAGEPYQRLAYQPTDLPPPAVSPDPEASVEHGGGEAPAGPAMLEEERAVFVPLPPAIAAPPSQTLPQLGRRIHDLKWWQTLTAIVAVAAALTIAAGSLINSMEALSRIGAEWRARHPAAAQSKRDSRNAQDQDGSGPAARQATLLS